LRLSSVYTIAKVRLRLPPVPTKRQVLEKIDENDKFPHETIMEENVNLAAKFADPFPSQL
jgi:hypothetical protein